MAIYHLNVRTGSRNGGQSAKAKHQYVTRTGAYRRRDPEQWGYGNMPSWAANDPGSYWQAADERERSNGRLFREFEVALPREVTGRDRDRLVAEFIAEVCDRDLPWTAAVHDAGGNNPHLHLVVSERANDGIERGPEQWFKRANKRDPARGGAAKTKRLESREALQRIRARWAELANAALEKVGAEDRIDHRSLEEQGIDRLPGVHVGPAAAAMERRGEWTQRGAEARRRRQLLDELVALDEPEPKPRSAGRGPGVPGAAAVARAAVARSQTPEKKPPGPLPGAVESKPSEPENEAPEADPAPDPDPEPPGP